MHPALRNIVLNAPKYIKFPCAAGLFDFQITNATNVKWVFPDGYVSTAYRPAYTMPAAGTVKLYCKFKSNTEITDNTTDARYRGSLADLQGKITYKLDFYDCVNLTGRLADLQGKITYYLGLGWCPNITGSLADLQGKITYYLKLTSDTLITGDLSDLQGKITYYLALESCSLITGDLADLQPDVPYTLYLQNCPLITGDLADLQGKVGSGLNLTNCSLVSGVYSPLITPSSTTLTGTGMSTTDIDNTLIAYASAPTLVRNNGSFTATGKNRTAASDAAVATLEGKGWTISGISKV